MIDPIQILLTVIVTILTTLLVVIGVEVFKILKEFRQTLKRANKILDEVEKVSSTLCKPVEGMSSLISGIKQGTAVVKVLTKFLKNEDNGKSD